MKNMLIAATAVGATIAGLVLYTRKKANRNGQRSIEGAAKKAYKTMNAGIGSVERSTLHTMG